MNPRTVSLPDLVSERRFAVFFWNGVMPVSGPRAGPCAWPLVCRQEEEHRTFALRGLLWSQAHWSLSRHNSNLLARSGGPWARSRRSAAWAGGLGQPSGASIYCSHFWALSAVLGRAWPGFIWGMVGKTYSARTSRTLSVSCLECLGMAARTTWQRPLCRSGLGESD